MTKTIREMTAEIRAVNVEKGWRPADGGPGSNTWGDYIALLHSEVSEALEAYRDHRLEDATETPDYENGDNDPEDGPTSFVLPKPEGVGSEFADVLIRLLDMCDVFGVPIPYETYDINDVPPWDVTTVAYKGRLVSFGDWITWMHGFVTAFGDETKSQRCMLRVLVTFAHQFDIDLAAEYERKIAFNRTRSYQHGGRTMANPKPET